MYKNDLVNMDVSYRKLCRQIVGPPPGTNWSLDWHEILHFWNERVNHFSALAGVKFWSQSVCTHYWKFARYVACLPPHRWVKRVLAWNPPGSRTTGRPALAVGIKNWFLIVVTKILDIGWTLLTVGISFGRLHRLLLALSVKEISCTYFVICSYSISFARLCPMGPAICFAYKLDSPSPFRAQACVQSESNIGRLASR